MSVVLNYGQHGRFECAIPREQLIAFHAAPEPVADLRHALRQALEDPIEFPPLARAVVPGDHVVLALDRHTPQAATLIAAVYEIIAAQGVSPADILILQPTALAGPQVTDPRISLPEDVRAAFGVSKKAFKQAIGILFKAKRIVIEQTGIRLPEPNR